MGAERKSLGQSINGFMKSTSGQFLFNKFLFNKHQDILGGQFFVQLSSRHSAMWSPLISTFRSDEIFLINSWTAKTRTFKQNETLRCLKFGQCRDKARTDSEVSAVQPSTSCIEINNNNEHHPAVVAWR